MGFACKVIECEERVGRVGEGNIFLYFSEEIKEGRGGESL